MTSKIKTRILILSDSHGQQLKQIPQSSFDAVIHCGDLTEHSKLSEFQETIHLLHQIRAPVKVVIPGNHDFSLDQPAFERKMAEARRISDDPDGMTELLGKDYGEKGAAQSLWESASLADSDIFLLNEGDHSIKLSNGTHLKIYASPYTPSTNDWGFQYSSFHDFRIGDDVDIAITHGPPRGIMDMTAEKKRVGCPMLFRAIAKAQPRIHCFGHVHDGWGAKLVTWRPEVPEDPSHFNSIDNEKSQVIENLLSLQESRLQSPEEAHERVRRIEKYEKQGFSDLSHCADADLGLGKTLFVNAATKGGDELDQLPWLVEVDLSAQVQ